MWLDTLWRLAALVAGCGSSNLAAGAGALVGVLLVAAFVRVLAIRSAGAFEDGRVGRGLRSRAERAGVPRHRDPDAAGRTRPRGPTVDLAVA